MIEAVEWPVQKGWVIGIPNGKTEHGFMRCGPLSQSSRGRGGVCYSRCTFSKKKREGSDTTNHIYRDSDFCLFAEKDEH